MLGYCLLQFYNPMSIESPISKYNRVSNFLPQGWGFFTKDPTEELFDIYEVDHKGMLVQLNESNSSASNLFGFSKKNRFKMIEYAILYENLKGRKWFHTKGLLETDTITEYDTLKLQNDLLILKKNKIYYLAKHSPVPFAWSMKDQEKNKPYEFIKIYVSN